FNGELIVGGRLESINGQAIADLATWDGSNWNAFDAPVNDFVEDVIVFEGDLIVAGNFTEAGGVPVKYVGRWNGNSWTSLNTVDQIRQARTLHVASNELYLTGAFVTIGNVTLRKYAAGEWKTFRSTSDITGFSVVEFRGDIVTTGYADSGLDITLDRWQGDTRILLTNGGGLGPDDEVTASIVHNGKLVVAGEFSQVGTEQVDNSVQWDGESWIPFSADLPGAGHDIKFAKYHGDLIASVRGSKVVRWNGSSWEDLAEDIFGNSHAVAVDGDNIYVGGEMYDPESVTGPRRGVVVWDGAGWAAVGGTFEGSVLGMAIYNGELIVGGNFTQADGTPVNYVARWDGDSWEPMGSGAPDQVNVVSVEMGKLTIAGGASFGYPGFVSQWDGTQWIELGPGSFGGHILALASYDCNLYAGSSYERGTYANSSGIAKWDGSSWISLGSGLGEAQNTGIHTMTVYKDKLYVGGFFAETGGQAAYGFSSWTEFPESGCCDVAGDADKSSAVDVGDATFLINRIFTQGVRPCCPEQGDVNGDGKLSIGDVSFLISYIFISGQAPVCGTNGI
ncbi:hypothetical protein JYT16_02400, partial [Gemmatimonas aurantiaca]|nr:hypothetical protein [Gemmatimonas aurantiaca]